MASLRPSSTSLGILLLASVSISLVKSSQAAPFVLPHPRVAFLPYVIALDVRGGSTQLQHQEDDDTQNNEEEDPEVIKKREALRKYRMEQQMLMQLRSTFLSEALAKRGLPMTTLLDVSTPEGDKPPEKVDWDCAMSTEDDPKVTCHLSPRKTFHSFLKSSSRALSHRLASFPLTRSPTPRWWHHLEQHSGFLYRPLIDSVGRIRRRLNRCGTRSTLSSSHGSGTIQNTACCSTVVQKDLFSLYYWIICLYSRAF